MVQARHRLAQTLLNSMYEPENTEIHVDLPDCGPQRYAEATYALIEARCDRDTAIENRRLQLEEDRLRFEINRHEEKMKLKEMELQQRQAEQEAKFKLK
ncbi:hypothetical protein MRX96_055597 [Rhipicephalus microplus]